VSLHIAPKRTRSVVPSATVQRLPIYLHVLSGLRDRGVATISSADLAANSGVTSAKLRKDLSFIGSFGRRGVGYDVDYLHSVLTDWLGVQQQMAVVIVGVGNLGHALASYPGFIQRGFVVEGLVDSDPRLVGQIVQTGRGAVCIEAPDQLTEIAARCQIGVIATPDVAAQNVCDHLIIAGIRDILTFASRVLVVPDGVQVRHIDLGAELAVLASRPRRMTAVSA
jgi:redox-sensing transcriptional repressor